jgi:hypothetical protein
MLYTNTVGCYWTWGIASSNLLRGCGVYPAWTRGVVWAYATLRPNRCRTGLVDILFRRRVLSIMITHGTSPVV